MLGEQDREPSGICRGERRRRRRQVGGSIMKIRKANENEEQYQGEREEGVIN